MRRNQMTHLRSSMTALAITLTALLGTAQAQEPASIAVMDLEGANMAAGDLVALSDRLRAELFTTGKFTVVERSRMDEILKEQGFQRSGCTNAECAVELGQIIGVQKMVIGSLNKVGDIYTADVRMVDVASGKIERVATQDCEACGIGDVLKVTLHNAARMVAGLEADRTVSGAAPQPAAQPSSAAPPDSDEARRQAGISDTWWEYYRETGLELSQFKDWQTMRAKRTHGAMGVVLGAVFLGGGIAMVVIGPNKDISALTYCGGAILALSVAVDVVAALDFVKSSRLKKKLLAATPSARL